MSAIPVLGERRPVVAVVGGAVSGSEAARALCARGASVVVFEQNDLPYGKIRDGLPRWHEKLQQQEYARIDENLDRPGVAYVPRCALGRDVQLDDLVAWGFSAVVLANGAWRDRSLPIDGIDAYLGRGLAYQNAFVYAFNHADPAAPLPMPGRVLVVGGGLASVDVAKIVNLELYRAALRARGHAVDTVALETAGIPETCTKLGVDVEGLGVEGATLVYRRRKQDMPLAQVADDSPAARTKAEVARTKIMERVERKYRVRFLGLTSPSAALVEGDRLVGLRCTRCIADGSSVRAEPDGAHDLRADLVVSSIGSVPMPLAGVPMRGELYDFVDEATGLLRGTDRVFGLGNVLTGRGNIKDSRQNALQISDHVASVYLGVGAGDDVRLPSPRVPEATLDAATAPVRAADEATQRSISERIEALWAARGYGGSYAAHIRTHGPAHGG